MKSNVTHDLPIQETNVLHMDTPERLPFSNAAIKKKLVIPSLQDSYISNKIKPYQFS